MNNVTAMKVWGHANGNSYASCCGKCETGASGWHCKGAGIVFPNFSKFLKGRFSTITSESYYLKVAKGEMKFLSHIANLKTFVYEFCQGK